MGGGIKKRGRGRKGKRGEALTPIPTSTLTLTFTLLTHICYPTLCPPQVFIFIGFQMLLCNCAVALSNMCSCLCVSIEMSVVVLSCAMEISRQYGAFFVSPVLMDDYSRWKFFDQIRCVV